MAPLPAAQAGEARVYYLEMPRRGSVVVVAIVCTLVGLILSSLPFLLALLNPRLAQPPPLAVLLLVVGALVWLALGVAVASLAWRVRLVTSSQGITYHQLGYAIHSTWDNLLRVQLVPVGFALQEGLVLREPGLRAGRFTAWQLRIARQDRIIPLTLFGWWWRDGALGEDLRRYAPHLLPPEPAPPVQASGTTEP